MTEEDLNNICKYLYPINKEILLKYLSLEELDNNYKNIDQLRSILLTRMFEAEGNY